MEQEDGILQLSSERRGVSSHTTQRSINENVEEPPSFSQHFGSDFEIQKIAELMLLSNYDKFSKYRRVHWLILLGVLSPRRLSSWREELAASRTRYENLQETSQIKKGVLSSLDPQIFHPLSNLENNPWKQHHKNGDLLDEIWKDVVRTFPEKELFCEESTRQMMQRILFVWCKEHHDISYKQGMNELLALCILVCSSCTHSENVSEGLEFELCSPNFIEADSFIIFSRIMHLGMRQMYNNSAIARFPFRPVVGHPLEKPFETQFPGDFEAKQAETMIILRCKYIFNQLLKRADPLLHQHFQSFAIEPQIYLLRWIRLLFSREFKVENTLLIWDAIFADLYSRTNPRLSMQPSPTPSTSDINAAPATYAYGSSMPLVDYFAVAMMKYIRSDLLGSDFSGCLGHLLAFPSVESVLPLIRLAVELRAELTAQPIPKATTEKISKVNVHPATASEDHHLPNSTDSPRIKTMHRPWLSGASLGKHVLMMENRLNSVLTDLQGNASQCDLEMVSHDLSILRKTLRGDIEFDSKSFVCAEEPSIL